MALTAGATGLQLHYGGTFDPIHNGHLAIALAASEHFGVAVRLVPAADPPHRARPGATARQRLAMVQLAIAGLPQLVADPVELVRAEACPLRPSYTVDTLAALRQQHGPRVPLAWLIGGDSLVSLERWHRWQDLFRLGHVVVAARPGSDMLDRLPSAIAAAVSGGGWTGDRQQLLHEPAGCLYRLEMPLRGESSTRVRESVARGEDITGLVPAPVAGYVTGHQLYGVDGT